ncbi:class F sortase [Alteribacter aurantiacus]|uniref:class F sortase n=1 Tax=Alteribacter aurantiacus TaxID=254410 RepID=UPI00041066B9|nr:class F sortase [Alteribacter aurantiacus]
MKINKLFPFAVLLALITACGTEDPSSAQTEEGISSLSEAETIEQMEEEPSDQTAETLEQNEETATPIETVQGTVTSGITPTSVEIPSLNINAPIESLGLTETGAMDVPEDGETVGWYNRGAKPGARGNAVLAGHVDDYTGPAVFFDLKELNIGDEVVVYGERDEALMFEVVKMERYPYDDAPIRDIFGYTNSQRLNLITCTGEFDRVERTHRERLVVYTELKE